jgi:hypothetical protein
VTSILPQFSVRRGHHWEIGKPLIAWPPAGAGHGSGPSSS